MLGTFPGIETHLAILGNSYYNFVQSFDLGQMPLFQTSFGHGLEIAWTRDHRQKGTWLQPPWLGRQVFSSWDMNCFMSESARERHKNM